MQPDGSSLAGESTVRLVGRTDELARLADLADAAVERGAQMVLLAGDAGIGKSSLVSIFLDQLGKSGWGRHVGHCIEFADRPLPFGPIVAILRSILLDNVEAMDQIIGEYRADLVGLIPELRDDEQQVTQLGGDVDRLFDGIAKTLIRASYRRPIAVLVEDIHWADGATRDLLSALVHGLGSARVLILVTERTAALEMGHPLRTWLAEQRRFPNVASIELEGLSSDELTEQAAAILEAAPDPEFIADLLDRTGGNAYFASEILMARRDGNSEIPVSLVEFLTSRLETLSPEERETLRAVAVAGGTVSHRVLDRMVPSIALESIVRPLFEKAVLVVDGTGYTFRHALLREAILRDVLPFEAEELHRLAAEAILADPQLGATPSDLAGLAVHWANANEPARSLPAAVAAGEASAGVAAYGTAAEMSVQALEAWTLVSNPEELSGLSRFQLLLKSCEWLAAGIRGADAVEAISTALDDWAGRLASDQRALLMAVLAHNQYYLGNPIEASAAIARAQDLVGSAATPEAAQVHFLIARDALSDGRVGRALEAADRAVEIASAEGPVVTLIEAMMVKGLAAAVTDGLSEGLSLIEEARALALDKAMVSQVASTYRFETHARSYCEGRTDTSIDRLVEGLDFVERRCGPRWRQDLLFDLALGYVEAGRMIEAKPLLDQLLKSPLPDFRRLNVLHAAGLHALGINATKEAEDFLISASELAERYQSAQETGFQNRILAELARRQGKLDLGLELIDSALKLQLESDNLTFTRESLLERIRLIAASVIHGVDMEDAISQMMVLVENFTGDGEANVAFRLLMETELGAIQGRLDPAEATTAIERVEACGFRNEGGQARLVLIDHLLDETADRDQAETELAELVGGAAKYGLAWLGERAHAVARAAKIMLEPEQPDPAKTAAEEPAEFPHDLTAREVEVMSLLAEGLTNKGIGEQLYVSPRTVGTHVSNLLAKLGASNRGEAAAAYVKLGLNTIDLRDPLNVD